MSTIGNLESKTDTGIVKWANSSCCGSRSGFACKCPALQFKKDIPKGTFF